MKATFKPEYNSAVGKIASNRKEKHFNRQLTLVTYDGEIKELVQARFYVTPGRHYCCIWVNDNRAGGGFAGGYGYHRPSAALQCALDNAGIVLSEAIDGRGDGAMEAAIMAIGVALGYVNTPLRILQAHA